MSEPFSRIPSFFPNLAASEVNTRRLIKSSLIRRIAEAQNFLWSHGRVYAANGYEGNGYRLWNSYEANDGRELELQEDGSTLAMCVCTFLVPRNWNKRNVVKVSYEIVTPDESFVGVILRLEDKTGTLITSVSEVIAGDGSASFPSSQEIEVSGTGEYQVRVLFTYAGPPPAPLAGPPPYGTTSAVFNHVSARWLEDDTVDDEWFQFDAAWAFSNDYPVASVLLNKLVRNTIHLWARRTPEICQASIGQNYCNTSTFTQVARYVAFVSHRCNTLAGQLVVNCTHSGAGNEIRLKMDGSVIQTFTALSAGHQVLVLSAFSGVTGNAEHIFTVEAKSTAAGADWGTVLLGVQIWENDTDIISPPADYTPLDFLALEGDDAITAQTVNAFGQSAGLRKLFSNDRWLAHNRLKVLVGDWLHKTLKNGVEFAADTVDRRVAWTYSEIYGDRPRNITVGPWTNPIQEAQDGMATWDALLMGLADTSGGYSPASPYTYPNELQYTNYGQRLGLYSVFKVFSGAESAPRVVIKTRVRRVRPYFMTIDGTGTGPASADEFYVSKGFLQVDLAAGATRLEIHTPPKAEDWLPQWILEGAADHETGPYDLQLAGRLRSQYEASEGDATNRPEGMLFEMELCSCYIVDAELTEADLKELF